LEILDTIDEEDDPHPLSNQKFQARCTLEIFVATYDISYDVDNPIPGEDLWRDQQICDILTKCDDFGHSTTHVLLPKPFIIPASELLVKTRLASRHNEASQQFKLGLAGQYIVKIWLEAPNPNSPWPPVEVESNLDFTSRIAKWLRDGKYSRSDIRLVCKGILFPETGAHGSFDLTLKLGGLRIKSHFALKLDIQYSLPPRTRWERRALDVQDIEASVGSGRLSEVEGLDITIREHCPSSSEAGDADAEHIGVPKEPVESSPKSFQLTVPWTERRLCDTDIKNVLVPGEEIGGIDSNREVIWRLAKHASTIEARSDISNDTKEYIMKWDSFVMPLRLSSKYYVPHALTMFVSENMQWFHARKTRMKEFGLHVTSLRLRGIIDLECFAKCVNLLRECVESHKRLDMRNREVFLHDADRDSDSDEHIDGSWADKVGTIKETSEVSRRDEDPKGGDARNEDTTVVQSLSEKVADLWLVLEESPDRTTVAEDSQNTSAQNQVVGVTHDPSRPTPQEYSNGDAIDDDLTYEDASEELEILDNDDYFDAGDDDAILHQPHYLQFYWQSLTQRWPRLKLHSREHFGIATAIAAIAIFQGFPSDNIDRLIALHIHHCPNENIQDLVRMYNNSNYIAPVVPGVFMTEQKLHRVMWEAGRELCEVWLTDVYRLEDGTRRTVEEAVETAASAETWDELWIQISNECGGGDACD
jgi:hypothetical protein